MKKLLLACMLALNFGLSAQITISESFETAPTPAGWTATNGTTTLTNVYSGASAGTSCQGTKHVFLNMYGSYPTWHHTYSSTFSNGEALDYSFSYLAKGWSTSGVVAGTVAADYSVDNGATWTEILAPVTLSSPNATPIPCATVTGTIPAGTIPTGANFKFRLKATRTGSGDFYMGFDNVQLTQVATTAPSCTTISAPANNATGISITPTITWAAAAGATSYDIAIGTTAGAADVLPLTNVTGTSYILPSANALNYSSSYFVTVYPKNSLGTATGCTSNSFTTRAIPCPTVTAPAANAKEVSLTPTITWNAVAGATGYRISVGTTANGTDILNNVDLGNVTQYVFATPLLNSTRYYYTVNSYNAVSNSASCTNRVFDTVCQTFTSPYTQTFTGSVGPCWTFASGGDTTNGPAGTSQMWYPGSFLNGPGSNNAVKINLYYQNNTGWLISPAFDLTAGGYRVKFDYGVTDYADTAPSAMGADDVVNFLVSTNGGTTWTVLETWDDANTPTNNLNQYIYIIPAGTSVNNVKFAFYGTDGSVDDTVDFEFFVDNFVIEAVPSCLEPTQFTVTGYTFNSVSLSWQAPTPAPANGYQVYYSTVNTAPTATTMLDATNSVTSTSTTASIGGLTASTTYYIWVRSDCGTSQSPWAAGGSFATACAAIVPTYTNDFTTFPGFCWSYASGGDPSTGPTGTNQDFLADEFLNAIGGSNSAKINLWNAGTHAWLISPEFNLTGGDYIVSFDYGMTEYAATTAGTLGSDDVIQFLMSTDGGATWTVLNTWNSTTPISNTSTAYSYTVTGGTSSVMFAIYASEGTTDDTSDNDVFFDNFQVISTTLGTTDVIADKKSVKVYPNPFTDVLHISDIKDVTSVTITDMAGRTVRTIAKPSAQLQLGELNSGLYLVTLKYKDGSVKTVKAIKK